ncbi:MFS transporter [Pseudomonas syringae pv. actinidiae]|nr:MFS transporter [Pseudomonas syringae pv. actinidiae]
MWPLWIMEWRKDERFCHGRFAAKAQEQLLSAVSDNFLFPFGLGHFVSYLFRTVNAVIYVDLQTDLSLPASSLGLLTGVYFLTFAAAQIPLGVILDRYGPRSVQAPMLLFAVAGSVIFSVSSTETGLLIGRGLIGLGVAGSLMSAIKACAIWLPVERLPLSTACLLSIGGLGAMASTTPLHTLLSWLTWREAFLVLALLTFCVAVVIHFSVPKAYESKKYSIQRHVCCGRQTVLVVDVLASGVVLGVRTRHLHVGAVIVDGAVVARHGGLSDSAMASVLVGSGAIAMVGGVSDVRRDHRLPAQFGVQPIMICGTGMVIFIGFQVLMASGLPVSPYLIAMGFSFFGTSTTMNYAIVRNRCRRNWRAGSVPRSTWWCSCWRFFFSG